MRALDDLKPVPGAARPDLRDGRARSRRRSTPAKTLIGFAGSSVDGRDLHGRRPGQPRPVRSAAPGLCRSRPVSARSSSASRTVTLDYLSGQIEAGAEAVQLFDSWAGSLAPAEFERWVIAPTARHRRSAASERHPRRSGHRLSQGRRRQARRLCARNRGRRDRPRRDRRSGLGERGAARRACRCRAISTRWRCSPAARRLKQAVERILDAFAERPHIFNLGHGILQETPIAHVEQLMAR